MGAGRGAVPRSVGIASAGIKQAQSAKRRLRLFDVIGRAAGQAAGEDVHEPKSIQAEKGKCAYLRAGS